MIRNIGILVLLLLVDSQAYAVVNTPGVRIKELCRVIGVRDNALFGHGIMTGLSGTGDSSRNKTTMQSLANTLRNLGLTISAKDINSRNVAAVMVTTRLPAYARPGDKLDVNVTSIGDARSLLGGSLMLTHLRAANGRIYALAQGQISVGGFKYDLNGNVIQKNHTTAGSIPNGATVETETTTSIMNTDGEVVLKLHSPDFTTASRIKSKLNESFNGDVARAIDAGRIAVTVPKNQRKDLMSFLMKLEGLRIKPDFTAKVVVNERTGTVVAGGNVTISDVTISHGDLKVSIATDFLVSQPFLVNKVGSDVRTQVVPDTKIDVVENKPISLTLKGQTSVADLVAALNKIKTSSRDVITILQVIKRAGALNAELIVQ